MLFYTWPFLLFMLVVLPGYFVLRRTRFWILWLLAASYFFYAWWNPYYLLLVIYSTTLDYLLVALMDHCPRKGRDVVSSAIPVGSALRTVEAAGRPSGTGRKSPSLRDGAKKIPDALRTDPPVSETAVRSADPTRSPAPPDPVLRAAFWISASLCTALLAVAIFGPITLRPALIALAALVLFMAIGARLASRRAWLVISIINNLALLLFFKYAGFVEENLNQVLHFLHVAYRFPAPSTLMPHGWAYALPVGISFFTFQSMSYTIDFYLGKAPRERNILRFATFVCFFPQLMAGPIERARQMLPQFQLAPPFRLGDVTDGMSLFLVGLFKKMALANYLGIYVDRVYNNNPAGFDATTLVLATIAFAWQIFFDFSGYTDMARGLARMLGFNLVLNFNNPYLAAGLGEFWSRWHISLSTWFRDYLYIPLGGNRRGTFATYRNLFVTFLISGIWHGAAWTFAIWGVLHAAGVMLTRGLERSAFYRERVPLAVKRTWVFAYVCFAWVFFRANSLSDAGTIVSRIFTAGWRGAYAAVAWSCSAITRRADAGSFASGIVHAGWHSPQVPALMLALVGGIWLYQLTYESLFRPILRYSPLRIAMAAGMLLYVGLCSTSGQAFIYFQF
jgi:alginate O-acetyltransferase complex protein AlgI